MEKKIKWLLSCLAFCVFFKFLIYINYEDNVEEYGIYHNECQCQRNIKEEKLTIDHKLLTCSMVSKVDSF